MYDPEEQDYEELTNREASVLLVILFLVAVVLIGMRLYMAEYKQPPKHDTPQLAESKDKLIAHKDLATGDDEFIEVSIRQFGNTEPKIQIVRHLMKDGEKIYCKLGRMTTAEWVMVRDAVQAMLEDNLLE